MKRLFLITSFTCLLFTCNAQQIYQRLYENDAYGFSDIVRNPDSTYTLFGTIDYWFYLLKIDDAGNTIWEKFLRPSFGIARDAQNLFLLPDGYLIAGIASDSTPPDYDRDFIIAKTDTAGNPQWLKRINSSLNDYGSLIKCFDGSYFMTFGRSGYVGTSFLFDYNIIKLDNTLQIIWAKRMPMNQPLKIEMLQLHDSCIVFSSLLKDSTNQVTDVLFKMDLNGNYMWQKEIKTQLPGFAMQYKPEFELPDGTIICSGFYNDTITGNPHGLVYLKVDSNGYAKSLTNFYPINPAYGEYDGKAFCINSNRFVLIHGGGIIIIDSLNNIVNQKFYSYATTYILNYYKRSDLSYFFIGGDGVASGANYLGKADSLFNGTCTNYSVPFTSTPLPFITTIVNFTDSATSFTESYGFVTGNPVVNKYLVCNTATQTNEEQNQDDLFSIYPNPFMEFIYCSNSSSSLLECKISDAAGKIVMNFNIDAYKDSKYETGFIKPGIYFLNIASDNFIQTKKIIKIN